MRKMVYSTFRKKVWRKSNVLIVKSPTPLSSFFELNTDTRTRGHSLKLFKHRCHLEIRHFFLRKGDQPLE